MNRFSDDLDAFKAMTVAKGKTAGQRLAIVAVEIGDDEQPVTPILSNSTELKPKGGELAKLAGQMCNNPVFMEWCGAANQEQAAEWIRVKCMIESRSELDHSEAAARIFHTEIRRPFAERAQ